MDVIAAVDREGIWIILVVIITVAGVAVTMGRGGGTDAEQDDDWRFW